MFDFLEEEYEVNKVLNTCFDLRKYNEEVVEVIALDDNYHIVSNELIASGDRSTCTFRLPDIFQFLNKKDCKKFVLTHNHLYGRCDPSEEDDEATKKIMELSNIHGFDFLDHIIVKKTNDKYYSYREHNFAYTANNAYSSSLPDD